MLKKFSKLAVFIFFLTHLQIQSKVNLLESYLEYKKKASYEQYSKDCLNKNNWESCSDTDFILLTKLLNEEGVSINPLVDEIVTSYGKMFKLGEPANYEPDPKDSFESLANLSNMTAEEIAYDAMLEKEGRALIYHPLFNYQTGDLSLVEKMLKHPYTISGLGDAGAHCGAISDASFPTTLVQHWSRDRSRGNKLPLEKVIKMQTSETANLLGIKDRGIIEEGYKADINVIDYEKLTLHEPEIINDLPAGGRRLVQKASGYDYTIVSGEIAFIKGEATGALNGRLIRNSH